VSGTPARQNPSVLTVGPGFFTTMQIPLLRGREMDEHDRASLKPVAVVNQAFAQAAFGDQNPIGQHLNLPLDPVAKREIEIVGVSTNAHYSALQGAVHPTVYLPFDLAPWGPAGEMVYELRTAGNPLAHVDTVRQIVRQADARVPLSDVKTQTAWIDQTINQEIVFAKLCTAFAILALVIACVGLYGTISYNVARRTSEIGIRMALGAQRGGVVRMILRQVVILAALGLAIGMPTALATSKLVASFLYGTKPNDPVTLVLAVSTLLCAALLAGYAPARRASRIDPMTALRNE
jgi:macrolide transport system ATP-binding/permease protein